MESPSPGRSLIAAEARPAAGWRTQVPLLGVLFLVLVLGFVVFRFFLLTFTVAASAAMMLAPAQKGLSRRLGGRRTVSAAILTAFCTLLILVPMLGYGTLLAQQAAAFIEWLRPRVEPAAFEKLWREDLPARYPLVASWMREWSGGNAMALAHEAVSRLASAANRFAQVVIVGLVTAFFDLLLFLMMVFFLLRDGHLLREGLRGVSPLNRGQETELIDHLTRTIKGVLQSMVLVPLAQGLLALVGFLIFGVPGPLLWSVMVAFAALIPLVGSPLAWVPAGLYLLVSGSTARGVGLLLYGVLVISTIDNVIKPLILKGAAQIHTMLGFLSILGGLYAFGPKGLIAGPVILSLILSAYRIYRFDVLRWRAEASWPGLPHP